MSWKPITIAIVVILLGLGGYLLWPERADHPFENSETVADRSKKISRFGTMLAFQGGLGFSGNKTLEEEVWKGWATFRSGDSWDLYYRNLTSAFSRNAALVTQTNFSINRDVVGAFAWNVVQPTENGPYDWSMPDATMHAAKEAGIPLSAVVYPFGAWQTDQPIDSDKCRGIDFAFFGSIGYPKDMQSYEAFLTALVERYDGDGRDDMPGLATRVEVWEIGNEMEGPCMNNTPEEYLALLDASYQTVKAADPKALVASAGALEVKGPTGPIASTQDFWQEFFALGGATSLDIFTVHYNAERTQVKSTSGEFVDNVRFYRELLDDHGAGGTPIWLTEFGLPTSAAYIEYVEEAGVLGVTRFFIDLVGPDEGPIGPSTLFHPSGEAREFLSTLQELGGMLRDELGTETLADDFAPSVGADFRESDPQAGPWRKRLMTAVSTDGGKTFTKTGEVLTDQGNVPDLVTGPEGEVLMYYSAGVAGDKENVMAVARSLDDGTTWTFHHVDIAGEKNTHAGDPDVVKLEDGTYRLFYTSAESGRQAIYYADGTDGIHFTYGGRAFGMNGQVLDSMTFSFDDTWYMYAFGGTGSMQIVYATSQDGKTFTYAGSANLSSGGKTYLPGDPTLLNDGKLRMYTTGLETKDIRTFFSTDGVEWTIESSPRLTVTLPEEEYSVRDPAVLELPSGNLLLVYTTFIPGSIE